MKYLILLLVLASLNASAASKAEFCKPGDAELQNMLRDPANLMAFKNNGGLIDGGVCWWHSRYQRAATYLAWFRPELPKPGFEEVRAIINNLKRRKSVIEIPGYKNFKEFTAENEATIQKVLNNWQMTDAFIRQAWVRGLWGKVHAGASVLSKRMDDLYQRVQNGDIAFNKLQFPGVVAHAWLVIGMKRIPKGYELEIIDSNRPQEVGKYQYLEGMDSFKYYDGDDFSPSTEFKCEQENIREIRLAFCQDRDPLLISTRADRLSLLESE